MLVSHKQGVLRMQLVSTNIIRKNYNFISITKNVCKQFLFRLTWLLRNIYHQIRLDMLLISAKRLLKKPRCLLESLIWVSLAASTTWKVSCNSFFRVLRSPSFCSFGSRTCSMCKCVCVCMCVYLCAFGFVGLYIHNWADMEQENFTPWIEGTINQKWKRKGFKKKIDLANL